MIPILYRGNETDFTTNGLGRLGDIISCVVTEERNGVYEVELTYPITGKYYKTMVGMVEAYALGNRSNSGIIACIHDDKGDIQPFDLYSVSAPIDGVATFNAHHISYRLGEMVTSPFESGSAAGAIALLPGHIAGTNPFTFWTDKTDAGEFKIEVPTCVRDILGAEEGCFLDVFGAGEYEFNRFDVKLYASRGENTNLTIRYGKNMTDLTREVDSSEHYNAVAPYWKGSVTNESTNESEDVIVYPDSIYVQTSGFSGVPIVTPLDLSDQFEEVPTKQDLITAARKYLNDNKPWKPDDNIKVSFVQLWQTTEYENVAALQRVSLCDTVSVFYPDLGVTVSDQEVIKVVYNVILERYDEMELGKSLSSLSEELTTQLRSNFEADLNQIKKNAVTDSMMQAAISHATDMITGGLGGYVVFTYNADNQPEELLILNTPSIDTATSVWRFNSGGLGHASSYNGSYSIALTADGAINASMITTGTLNANIIKAGVISDQAGKNSWNLVSGDLTTTGTFKSVNGNYEMDLQRGQIDGYYGNSYCGSIRIAYNQPYNYDGYVGYKNCIEIYAPQMLVIRTPILCTPEGSSYQYNTGLNYTFTQDIVTYVTATADSHYVNYIYWYSGSFSLNFSNGLCVGAHACYTQYA